MSEESTLETIARLVDSAVVAHRDALVRRFGFTDLQVRATVDPTARTIDLRGRVLARRFARRVRAAVQAAAPAGWIVEIAGLVPDPPGPWHAVASELTRLLSAIPGDGRAAGLATELVPGDGPVQPIAAHAGFTLVRATDGTLGWTDAGLGDRVETPRLGAPDCTDPHAFVAAVRAYVGAPYRLGGTTPAGIDCSGLVQRALRDARAGLVPRHSSDQLAIDPQPGPGVDGAGDLVFLWTSAEAPCHVGVADGAGAVLHASRHRGVVADARADLLAKAERTRHLPWASILALQDRLVGAACLSEIFELGRRPA